MATIHTSRGAITVRDSGEVARLIDAGMISLGEGAQLQIALARGDSDDLLSQPATTPPPAALPPPTGLDPAVQAQIDALQQQRDALASQLETLVNEFKTSQSDAAARQQAEEQRLIDNEDKRQAQREEQLSFLRGLSSDVSGRLGGTFLPSPIGGLFGTEGIEVGPAVAGLSRGEVLGQPGSILSAIGLRPPSAQALSRLTPIELGEFAEVGRLAGIPQDIFASELTTAVPGMRSAQTAPAAIQPKRQRLF